MQAIQYTSDFLLGIQVNEDKTKLLSLSQADMIFSCLVKELENIQNNCDQSQIIKQTN